MISSWLQNAEYIAADLEESFMDFFSRILNLLFEFSLGDIVVEKAVNSSIWVIFLLSTVA